MHFPGDDDSSLKPVEPNREITKQPVSYQNHRYGLWIFGFLYELASKITQLWQTETAQDKTFKEVGTNAIGSLKTHVINLRNKVESEISKVDEGTKENQLFREFEGDLVLFELSEFERVSDYLREKFLSDITPAKDSKEKKKIYMQLLAHQINQGMRLCEQLDQMDIPEFQLHNFTKEFRSVLAEEKRKVLTIRNEAMPEADTRAAKFSGIVDFLIENSSKQILEKIQTQINRFDEIEKRNRGFKIISAITDYQRHIHQLKKDCSNQLGATFDESERRLILQGHLQKLVKISDSFCGYLNEMNQKLPEMNLDIYARVLKFTIERQINRLPLEDF